MGQKQCRQCCQMQTDLYEHHHELFSKKGHSSDEPSEQFAKKVTSTIDIRKHVSDIIVRQRCMHESEFEGTKLSLYYLFAFSAYYNGEWKKGLPHGFGMLTYDDGSVYQGCFNKGMAQCSNGFYVTDSETYYKGQIKGNKANGHGILVTPYCCYKGQWQDDQPHGYGKQTYANKSCYEGYFRRGCKEGMGIYRWNSDEYYEGEFKDNQMSGQGKLITNNQIYCGSMQNELRHGRGQLINWLDQSEYNGEFRNNQRHGDGEYQWPDGVRFQGQFESDKMKSGKLYLQNGEIVDFP